MSAVSAKEKTKISKTMISHMAVIHKVLLKLISAADAAMDLIMISSEISELKGLTTFTRITKVISF